VRGRRRCGSRLGEHRVRPVVDRGPVDIVFGRGGVRGIALAGAAAAFEERGYRFERVAGISAGGVVAALVASGYRAWEIRRVVWELDYSGMRRRSGLGRLPALGPAVTLLTRLGLYDGDALLDVFRALLAAKGVYTFGDLATDGSDSGSYRLRVVAVDVTRGRVIVLPDDAADYGVDPAQLEVALALRMTTSVPFYFQPVRFGSPPSLVVDGGLIAGIPFAVLENGDRARPTFGVQAGPGEMRRRTDGIRSPVSLLVASYYTALAANERCNRGPADAARTIEIECGGVGAVDFDIDDARKARLYEAGRGATDLFLARWAAPITGPRARRTS
jgi:NTE family protein